MNTHTLTNSKSAADSHAILTFSFFCIAAFLISMITVPSHAQVLSNTAYRPISEAQEAMANDDYPLALQTLQTLLNKGDRLKPFDKAKSLQLVATIYVNMDKIPEAIKACEESIALNSLDPVSASQLRYTLFNLYAFAEDYKSAIKHIEKWFELETSPTVQAFFSAARIYALDSQWKIALRYATDGMSLVQNDNAIMPQTNWYDLFIAIQLQLKEYNSARITLEKTISLWPEKFSYYRQLSGVYQELDRGKDSFATLSLARQNHLLSNASDLERLTQQYRFFGYPYKGAILYEKAKNEKIIPANEDAWSTLSDTFLQAREWSLAENALQEAAKLSDSGEHWLKLCQTSLQDERWNDSLQFCKNAVQKGKLGSKKADAWQFIAIAKYRTDDLTGAMLAFDRCLEIGKENERCNTWRVHIEKAQTAKIEEQKEIKAQLDRKKFQQERLNQQLDSALLIRNDFPND